MIVLDDKTPCTEARWIEEVEHGRHIVARQVLDDPRDQAWRDVVSYRRGQALRLLGDAAISDEALRQIAFILEGER